MQYPTGCSFFFFFKRVVAWESREKGGR